jgi:hypothetical protein
MPSPDQEKKLLDLITDLDRFSREKRFSWGLNIFDAAGMQRQEIRHSHFLAFLLRPQESHGLGDAFLKRLVQKALNNTSPVSALTVALADYSDALVSREWRNLDLLVESKNNKFVFVIENKIDSSEGDDQLSRYEAIVKSAFPNENKLFAYLTEDGEQIVTVMNESYGKVAGSQLSAVMEIVRRFFGSTPPAATSAS